MLEQAIPRKKLQRPYSLTPGGRLSTVFIVAGFFFLPSVGGGLSSFGDHTHKELKPTDVP